MYDFFAQQIFLKPLVTKTATNLHCLSFEEIQNNFRFNKCLSNIFLLWKLYDKIF